MSTTQKDDATIEEAPESNWTPAVTILSGRNKDRGAQVTGDVFTIGRAKGNKLVLNEAAVSRHHAKIISHAGHYVLHDLKSKWGTMLNGQKVTESELKFGDEIEIGGVRLEFNLMSKDSIRPPRTNWIKMTAIALLVLVAGSLITLFYFKHQVRQDLKRPAGDVLSQIMYHYDQGIYHYNLLNQENKGENRLKVIEEMKKVIELDPEGNTQFSRSARRIIDGLGK